MKSLMIEIEREVKRRFWNPVDCSEPMKWRRTVAGRVPLRSFTDTRFGFSAGQRFQNVKRSGAQAIPSGPGDSKTFLGRRTPPASSLSAPQKQPIVATRCASRPLLHALLALHPSATDSHGSGGCALWPVVERRYAGFTGASPAPHHGRNRVAGSSATRHQPAREAHLVASIFVSGAAGSMV